MNKLFYLVIATLISAGSYAELNVASAGKKKPPVEKEKTTSRKKKSKNIQTQQEDACDNLGNLAILPDEVLCQIFENLHTPKDFLNVAKTNKHAQGLINYNQESAKSAFKNRMDEIDFKIEEFHKNRSENQNKDSDSQKDLYDLSPDDIEFLKRTLAYPKNFENFYTEILTTEDKALRTNKIHILYKIIETFPEYARFLGKQYLKIDPTDVKEFDLATKIVAEFDQAQDEIRKTHNRIRIELFATPEDPEAVAARKEFNFQKFLELSQDSTKQLQLKSYLMSLKLLWSSFGDLQATARLTEFSNQINEYLNVALEPLNTSNIHAGEKKLQIGLKGGLGNFITMYPWFAYGDCEFFAFTNKMSALNCILWSRSPQLDDVLDLEAAEKFANFYFTKHPDNQYIAPSPFWASLANRYALIQDPENYDGLRIRQVEDAIKQGSAVLALYGIDALIKDEKYNKAIEYLTSEDFDKVLRQEYNPSVTVLSGYLTAMAILNLDNPTERLKDAKNGLDCAIPMIMYGQKKLPSEFKLKLQEGAMARNYPINKEDILTLQLTLALYEGEFDEAHNFLKQINIPFEEMILRAIEHQLNQGVTLPEKLVKSMKKDFRKGLNIASKTKFFIEDPDELAKFREILKEKYPMAINLLSELKGNTVEKTINTLEKKAEKLKIKQEKKAEKARKIEIKKAEKAKKAEIKKETKKK